MFSNYVLMVLGLLYTHMCNSPIRLWKHFLLFWECEGNSCGTDTFGVTGAVSGLVSTGPQVASFSDYCPAPHPPCSSTPPLHNLPKGLQKPPYSQLVPNRVPRSFLSHPLSPVLLFLYPWDWGFNYVMSCLLIWGKNVPQVSTAVCQGYLVTLDKQQAVS